MHGVGYALKCQITSNIYVTPYDTPNSGTDFNILLNDPPTSQNSTILKTLKY